MELDSTLLGRATASPEYSKWAGRGQAVLGSQAIVGPAVVPRILHHSHASTVVYEARLWVDSQVERFLTGILGYLQG